MFQWMFLSQPNPWKLGSLTVKCWRKSTALKGSGWWSKIGPESTCIYYHKPPRHATQLLLILTLYHPVFSYKKNIISLVFVFGVAFWEVASNFAPKGLVKNTPLRPDTPADSAPSAWPSYKALGIEKLMPSTVLPPKTKGSFCGDTTKTYKLDV